MDKRIALYVLLVIFARTLPPLRLPALQGRLAEPVKHPAILRPQVLLSHFLAPLLSLFVTPERTVLEELRYVVLAILVICVEVVSR